MPKFENAHEAVEYVMKLNPIPMAYVSAKDNFKRRLRIRLVDTDDVDDHTKKALSSRRKTRNSQFQKAAAEYSAGREQKPWMVEAAGTFFEKPSWKNRGDERKFYIAMAQDVAATVLQEGYKVKLRHSIPCSGSVSEALDAWSRNEARCNRKASAKASVYQVLIPPDVHVVTHSQKGFLIRTQELPPTCLKPIKKADYFVR